MSTKPKAQEASRPWIDTGEFARIGGELAAQQQPAQLPRLRELLAGDEGHVRWRLTGERRPRPEGGADAFLVKPVNASELEAQVRVARRILDLDELNSRRVEELDAVNRRIQRDILS